MSRALWTVEIPFSLSDAFLRHTIEVCVALPPASELVELRYLEGDGARLWFVGDMDELCAPVDFLWVRTGHEVPPRYLFVGLVLIKGSAFGLFVAGNAQTSNKVRTP